MPKFSYKLLNKSSKVEEGLISAWTKRGAARKLKREGATLIFLLPEKSFFLSRNIPTPFSKFSATEKINFFRNLAAMTSAGVSIVEALEILSDQVKNKKVRDAILAIAGDTRNGQRLSDAMAKHPKYFSDFLVEMVNMGDVSGRLTETLDRISDDLEKDDELKKKIRGALAYPVIIVVLMFVISAGLIVFVLPNIKKLFLEMNAPLPLPTKMLLLVGDFIRFNPFIIIGLIAGIILLCVFGLKTKRGRLFIHGLILKIPIFGPLIKDYNLVLFFSSLESLIKSGISIVYATNIAKKTVTNDAYKKAVETVQPVLLHGVHFADALKPYSDLFPVQTQKIIDVGEKSGQMEETLKRITKYYERAIDYKTRMMLTLIEPILMLVFGILVAGLALSIFLPLYQLASLI